MDFKTADPSFYGMLKMYARENRKNMTDAEASLWDAIKDRALGVKFLRQHIIGQYIVDFVSLEKALVIEVDGGYHSEPHQIADDQERQRWLEQHGFRVIRFTNEEVVFNIKSTINLIKSYLRPSEEETRRPSSVLPVREEGHIVLPPFRED